MEIQEMEAKRDEHRLKSEAIPQAMDVVGTMDAEIAQQAQAHTTQAILYETMIQTEKTQNVEVKMS